MERKPQERVRVAVVTVPITRREHVQYEHFEPGKLDRQRTELVKHIRANAKRVGAELEVTDFGDLLDESLTRPNPYAAGKKGDFIDEEIVAKLGKTVEALKKTHDLVIMLGELHTGAAFGYTGKGDIARFDAHLDLGEYAAHGADDRVDGLFRGRPFNYANYAGKALAHELWKGKVLSHYGLGTENASAESLPRRIDAEFFDIDIDVFKKEKYGIQKQYNIGVLDIPDVGKHIADSKRINTLGFFEYREKQDEHGTGMRFMKAASLAAIGAVARRKRGG